MGSNIIGLCLTTLICSEQTLLRVIQAKFSLCQYIPLVPIKYLKQRTFCLMSGFTDAELMLMFIDDLLTSVVQACAFCYRHGAACTLFTSQFNYSNPIAQLVYKHINTLDIPANRKMACRNVSTSFYSFYGGKICANM